MLDAYIIDAIRKEELEREREFERRRIFLELPKPELDPPRERRDYDDEPVRGPIVIPYGPDSVEDDAA